MNTSLNFKFKLVVLLEKCVWQKEKLTYYRSRTESPKTHKVSLKFLNDSLDVHDCAEGWCEMGRVLSCCHVLLGEHQGRGGEGDGGRRPGPESVFWGEDGIVFTSHQLNSPLPLPQAEGGAHTPRADDSAPPRS